MFSTTRVLASQVLLSTTYIQKRSYAPPNASSVPLPTLVTFLMFLWHS